MLFMGGYLLDLLVVYEVYAVRLNIKFCRSLVSFDQLQFIAFPQHFA